MKQVLYGWVAALTLLCLCRGAVAQPVPLEVKGGDVKTVKVDKIIVVKEDRLVVSSFPFTVQAPVGGGLYFWSYPKEVAASDQGDSLEVSFAPKGSLTVSVKCITPDWNAKKFTTTFGKVTLLVGEVPPGPTPPPVPPVPPDPVPPDPKPPAPIPEAGLRVLVVYESSELSKLPPAQLAIVYSKGIREYLNTKCAMGPDGKTKEWRIWDKDVDTSSESKLWQTAMKRPRASVPWVLISNGTTGFEGPLPGNAADALFLLKKFGGD